MTTWLAVAILNRLVAMLAMRRVFVALMIPRQPVLALLASNLTLTNLNALVTVVTYSVS